MQALTVVVMGLVLQACGGSRLGSLAFLEQVPHADPGFGAFTVRWAIKTYPPFTGEFNPVQRGSVTLDPQHDRIFLGNHRGTFTTLNSGAGELYRFSAYGALQSTPTLDSEGKFVYFGSDSGIVYALSAEQGRMRWQANVGGSVRQTPVIYQDAVYVVTENDKVVALSLDRGELLWRYQREGVEGLSLEGHAGILLYQHKLFTAFTDGAVVAFKASDGEVLWELDTSRDVEEPEQGLPRWLDVDTTPIVFDGQLCAASLSAGLYGIDVESGNLLWRDSVLANISAMTQVEGTSWLILSSAEQGVLAYDLQTKDTQWQHTVNGAPTQAAVDVEDSLVLVGESNGGLLALDLSKGTELSRVKSVTGFTAPPTTVWGQAFAHSNGGTLYALKLHKPLR